MSEIVKESERLKIRHVGKEDRRFLWKLANDSSVRERSFSTESIPWESHKEWFENKLQDENAVILIALNEDMKRVGVRRFDIKEDGSVRSSIIIKKVYRGKGYGTELIKVSNEYLFNNYDVDVQNAYIKPKNKVSIKAFEKAGYVNEGKVIHNGEEVIHLTYSQK